MRIIAFTFSLIASMAAAQTVPAYNCKTPVLMLGVRSDSTDVPLKSLSVYVCGDSADVANATADSGRRRILVMLDVSGSMTELAPEHSTAVQAAKEALKAVPVGSDAMLITFADKLYTTIRFTSADEGLKALASVQVPHGLHATALFDSLHQIVQLIGQPQFGDSVFLVSDGGDNRSHEDLNKAIAELQRHQVRVFAFEVANHTAVTPEEQ